MKPDERWESVPDAGLVSRARHPVDRAEREAVLTEIYRRHRKAVIGRCVAYLRTFDPDTALDATSDAFEVALRELTTGDNPLREPEKLRAWLYQVALNRCLEQLRKREIKQPRTADARDIEPDDEGYQTRMDEVSRMLDLVAGTFTRFQRKIFQLNIRQELRGKALAAALNMSDKVAYKRASENKKLLLEGFGTLALARHGRPHCPKLARILDQAAWNGENFTRVLRLRIIRHLGNCRTCDDCPVCNERKNRYMARYTPALIPFLIAPELNERVLEIIRRISEDEEDKRKRTAPATNVVQPQQKEQSSVWTAISGVIGFVALIVGGLRIINALSDDDSSGSAVTLHVWTPPELTPGVGGARVQSQPAGLDCVQQSDADPCQTTFPAGTTVTLTAVISPQLAQVRQLMWLGCGNQTPATQPCTVTLT